MVSDIVDTLFNYLSSTPPPLGVSWAVYTIQPQQPVGEILSVPGRCMMVLTEGGGDCTVGNTYRDMVRLRWSINCTLVANRINVTEQQFNDAVDAVLKRIVRIHLDCNPPSGVSKLLLDGAVSVQTGISEMRWLSMTDSFLSCMKFTIEAWRALT